MGWILRYKGHEYTCTGTAIFDSLNKYKNKRGMFSVPYMNKIFNSFEIAFYFGLFILKVDTLRAFIN